MKTLSKAIWLGLLLLFGLFVSLTGYHATDSTEVGVRTVKWLGKKGVENRVYQPGSAYFFLPIVNAWDTFDTRLQVIEMRGDNQLTIKTPPLISPVTGKESVHTLVWSR